MEAMVYLEVGWPSHTVRFRPYLLIDHGAAYMWLGEVMACQPIHASATPLLRTLQAPRATPLNWRCRWGHVTALAHTNPSMLARSPSSAPCRHLAPPHSTGVAGGGM